MPPKKRNDSSRTSDSSEGEDEEIFKDFCGKTNEQVVYFKRRGKSDPVRAVSKDITSWSSTQSFLSLIKDIFLPKGYPDSVSSDYLEYQIWDTCQAFCSSISGTCTIQAVMQGVGVGSDTATPVSAALTWLMKEGTGMIGSIVFAWSKGSKLDADCKKWRLFADILNDCAMCLELYIPYVLDYSAYMLCISTAMKSLVGVAGGATRAALTAHQAIRGNAADVSAKDHSQEIFVNLCALVFGIFLLKTVTEKDQIWVVMFTFTLFHLIFNYKAVTCLRMDAYNGERLRLSLRSYLPTSSVPSVDQVNKNESVFLGRGMSDYSLCGCRIYLGTSLNRAVLSQKLTSDDLSFLVTLFQEKRYFILPCLHEKEIFVSFRTNSDDMDVMKGYFHAILLALAASFSNNNVKLPVIERRRKNSPLFRLGNVLNDHGASKIGIYDGKKLPVEELLSCEDLIDREFLSFCHNSVEQGWNVTKHLLITLDWRSEWRYVQEKVKPNKEGQQSPKKMQQKLKATRKSAASKPNKAT